MTNVRATAEVILLQKEKVDAPTANRRAPHTCTMMQTLLGSSGQGSSSRSRLLAAPSVSSTPHREARELALYRAQQGHQGATGSPRKLYNSICWHGKEKQPLLCPKYHWMWESKMACFPPLKTLPCCPVAYGLGLASLLKRLFSDTIFTCTWVLGISSSCVINTGNCLLEKSW